MIRQEIIKLIQKSTNKPQKEIQVAYPEKGSFGDYSTNVALQLKKPAAEIIKKLKSDLFEKIEVAGPGFINFFLSKEYLQKQVGDILKKKERFGQLEIGKGKKISIEFICANPTGELHIGHGRGAFFGEALANTFQKAGFGVARQHYANDAKNSSQIKALGETALGKGTIYLNEYLEKKIKTLKSKFNKCKDEKEAGSLLAQEVQKDIKDFIEKKLKIKFDSWISEEKDLYHTGKIDKVYNFLKKKGLIYKKDGAEWLNTSKYGDSQDWVVIRETGAFTYLLPDIAYHKDRFDRKYDKIINIWGADHQGHVGKIKTVAKMLGYKGEMVFLICQVVRLRGEKMSKRMGKVVTLGWLIDKAGLDAVRFLYLMKSLDTHMEFDLDLAKTQSEKNPVYYVQYAHARICSILRKTKNKTSKFNYKLLSHPSEINLIKHLIRFPEVVEDTTKDYQVQRLPQYATDLAMAFHRFYMDCKVISDDKEMTQARLAMISATKIVLKNTLSLMGVSAPEKM